MNLRKFMLNKVFLSVADKLTRQKVVHCLKFYEESQWWPREHLIDYQSVKLRELLRITVAEVPFYKDLYRMYGVDIESVKSVDDLKMLPPVSKKELKSIYPNDCTRETGLPAKEYFTSGSSGNPFAVLVDNHSMSQARALMILRAKYSGWKIGDSAMQTGISLQRGVVKKAKDLLFDTSYVSAYDLSNSNLDQCLSLIKERGIKYLMGFPGSLYALAERAGNTDISLSLDGIVTWGDNLYSHFREKIEFQFKCKITDTYGCGEGIQVAAQCPSGNGKYHVFMPHVIVEVVDEEFTPVKRGERGNILLTRLEPGAMPLIRYQIGDLGRLDNSVTCSCGRGLESLLSIDGRDSDFIYTPNGNRLIVHFFTGIFEYYPQIDDFQIVQSVLNEIDVYIKPGTGFTSEVENLIRQEIFEKGDADLMVNFKIVQSINASGNGKRKFVISVISNE